ncbi:MAG TPA: helix-turn-helix domain-containing protein [Micromonosporaceae bacterium]|nr:helix-turn-helix domain-containing protein [Micromonosporaceae bacterium]
MIEYQLTHGDLADIRFAVSPISETVLSLRALTAPERYPLQRRWLRLLRESAAPADLDFLTSVLTRRGWTPDFLSPRPASPETTFEQELQAVAATPAELVAADVDAVPGQSLTVTPATADAFLERLTRVLADYWAWALKRFWPRMRAVLLADIAHRSRLNSLYGLRAVLADLSERAEFTPPVVRIEIPGAPSRRVVTGGDGLVLVPSVFALHTAIPVSENAAPMLIYHARGVGSLWEPSAAAVPDALTRVLGAVRARVLTELAQPTSSTELALRTGVTVSAANQHLRALRNAGVLESRRVGKVVHYARTDIADALVQHATKPREP